MSNLVVASPWKNVSAFLLLVPGLDEFPVPYRHFKVAEEEGNMLTPADPTHPKIRRSQSRAFLSEDGLPQPIEYFLASDPSAVVEHTKRVLYLEDNDIAHINEGGLLLLLAFV
jgi:glucosamine 6-phosphate synthetase-like amidotransferase/phosphosugar isomerase protein